MTQHMTDHANHSAAPVNLCAKRVQILKAAGEVFLGSGYAGASMSQIAQKAGVSKGALYNHFDSKDDLFTAFFEEMSRTKLSVLKALVHDEKLDTRTALLHMARTTIQLMLDATTIGLYRVILVDAPRFPNLADTFWHHGFGCAIHNLASWLTRKTAEGKLNVDDAEFAAEQFLILCQTRIVQRRRMSLPVDCDSSHIEHVARLTAESFLRIYAPTP
ncbi:TetR family transcriptional regulator [Saccharibacter sp. 17.LH.SD]|nr:TetR family transcriptional regulator [Saccharibacter sp. 17.LH.SD]